MAKPTKRSPTSTTLKYPVEVRVERAKFELFEGVQHLDIAALERARRAEIEVGYVKTDCCRQLVRAVVRKGEVTKLKLEPCDEDGKQPASPELTKLLKTAARKTEPTGERPPKFPIPVAKFIAKAGLISVDVLVCVRICFLGHCITCCKLEGRDDYICGHVTIDTTKPS